jgi:nicotinamide-nucleotide amidase
MIKAEIITIGDEILYGQITDTNSQFISTELDKIGVKTVRKSSVGDQHEAILQILAEAENRADIILMTGGLGPTKDDITKKTLAGYFKTELELHPQALEEVTVFFSRLGRELSETNRQQAFLPKDSTFISNKFGTAPCMWFERNGKVFVSMPGVPREMEGLMKTEILPRLQAFFKTPVYFHKFIRTIGIGESYLADKIADWEDSLPPHIRLAYLPSYGQVRLRLTASGKQLTDLQTDVQEQVDKVLPLIEENVFGYDQEELENAVGKLLIQQNKTLAVAESITGGYTSHLITKVPGCSQYFMGSLIAYDNQLKINELGVFNETLQNHGAVSEETVRQMAEGIRKKFGADIGIADTGIAGPDGGTEEKPVGTVWLAVADAGKTIVRKVQFFRDRDINIRLTAGSLLNLLRLHLLEELKS